MPSTDSRRAGPEKTLLLHGPGGPVVSADLLVLDLAQLQYAVPVSQVREVLPRASLTSLPGAPAGFVGVLRLRGVLLPVVDLRERLGLPPVAAQISQCIVVTHVDGLAVGLLVDAISGIVTAGEAPESIVAPGPGELLHRVAEMSGRVVAVLNLEVAVGAELTARLAALVADRDAAVDGHARVDPRQEGVP